MKTKNNNPLFDPLPDQRGFPNLNTGFESAEVASGKTSGDVFDLVFGKTKKTRVKRIVYPKRHVWEDF